MAVSALKNVSQWRTKKEEGVSERKLIKYRVIHLSSMLSSDFCMYKLWKELGIKWEGMKISKQTTKNL